MEPCIARCVFYITKSCKSYNVPYYYQRSTCFGRFYAHHQELIKLYVQPWLHIEFYKLLMMGGKPPETCRALII
jgi:hypothetical protein